MTCEQLVEIKKKKYSQNVTQTLSKTTQGNISVLCWRTSDLPIFFFSKRRKKIPKYFMRKTVGFQPTAQFHIATWMQRLRGCILHFGVSRTCYYVWSTLRLFMGEPWVLSYTCIVYVDVFTIHMNTWIICYPEAKLKLPNFYMVFISTTFSFCDQQHLQKTKKINK